MLRSRLRYAITLALVLLVLGVYGFSAQLLEYGVTRYLKQQGINAEFRFNRPTLKGITIESASLQSDTWSANLEEALIGLNFASIRERRIQSVSIRSVRAHVTTAGTSTREPTKFHQYSPWSILPVNHIDIQHFSFTLNKPDLTSEGSISLTPNKLDISTTFKSITLPSPFIAKAILDTTGTFSVLVEQLAEAYSEPILRLDGALADERLTFTGAALIDAPLFDLLYPKRNEVDVLLRGNFSGITNSTTSLNEMFSSMELSGTWDVTALIGENQRGSEIAGSIDFLLVDEKIELSSKSMLLTAIDPQTPFRLPLFDYTLSSKSNVELSFFSQPVPVTTRILDEISMNLSIKSELLFIEDTFDLTPDVSVQSLTVSNGIDVMLSPDSISAKILILNLGANKIIVNGSTYQTTKNTQVSLSGFLSLPPLSRIRQEPAALADASGELSAAWNIVMKTDAENASFSELATHGRAEMNQTESGAMLGIETGGYLEQARPTGRYAVSLNSPVEIRMDPTQTSLINPVVMLVGVPEVDIAGEVLTFDTMRIDLDALQITGNLLSLSANIVPRDQQDRLLINTELRLNLATLSGTFSATFEHQVNKTFLMQEFPGWQSDYDLTDGRVSLASEGSFLLVEDEFVYESAGTVHIAGDGYYNDISIRGIDVDLPFALSNTKTQAGPGYFTVDQIDVGFPITQVQFQLDVDDDLSVLQNLNGQLLGGNFTVDTLSYDLTQATGTFDIELHEIAVAEVLALEGSDFTADGLLDGRIRLSVNSGQVAVREGQIQSRDPGGLLSYRGAIGDAGNPGLKLALDALREFQYNKMRVSPAYTDGDLALKIRLEGSSPYVENNRPIHFNLTVNENIPALLRSLQTHEKLEQQLQNKVNDSEKLSR